jgi:methylmalonyl-CoA mutase N-terminal domain/subunit
VRTALRTQQIIAHESGVADTVDPLAGSYFIEAATDRIEAEAMALIGKIDQAGGVIACIEDGFIQRQIENSAYSFQCQVESGERIVVGVNRFQTDEEAAPPLLRLDPAVEADQVARLRAVRASRNQDEVDATLRRLREAATGSANLMPLILAAVKAYATIGEICQVLREVFGEHRDNGRL